jgi:hypothetical protein
MYNKKHMNKLIRFFDRLEDKVRSFLSHYPIVYAFIAGVGLVLFWRGVWHTADGVAEVIWNGADFPTTISIFSSFWDGPASLLLGGILMLASGVFVSELLGKEIIISGLRGEKKLARRTEAEVRTEAGAIGDILQEVHAISHRLEKIEERLDKEEKN